MNWDPFPTIAVAAVAAVSASAAAVVDVVVPAAVAPEVVLDVLKSPTHRQLLILLVVVDCLATIFLLLALLQYLDLYDPTNWRED